MESPRQVGALPIRRRNKRALEVLLVTTRETRRWVIPKGWPSKRLSDRKAALREAEEEAGISGDIAKSPLGQYKYFKRYTDGFQLVTVDVFLMAVLREHKVWPEQSDRTRAWLSVEAAAAAVIEPGLREIILSLAKRRPKPVAKGRIAKTLRARPAKKRKASAAGDADKPAEKLAAKRMKLKKGMLEKVRKAWT